MEKNYEKKGRHLDTLEQWEIIKRKKKKIKLQIINLIFTSLFYPHPPDVPSLYSLPQLLYPLIISTHFVKLSSLPKTIFPKPSGKSYVS
jgi:hypothetical protein